VEAGNFSLHCVQNGSGVHPASYPMGTRVFSLGVKRPEREADHSPNTPLLYETFLNAVNKYRKIKHFWKFFVEISPRVSFMNFIKQFI
jgi:hypothetical protein